MIFLSKNPTVLATRAVTLAAVALLPATGCKAAPLVSNGDFSAPLAESWTLTGKLQGKMNVVPVTIQGAPGITRALRLELVPLAGTSPWDHRLAPPRTSVAVNKGDLILVQFWGRSDTPTRVGVVYQQSSGSYEKTIRQVLTLRPQWNQYTFYAPARAAYPEQGSNFEIQLGTAGGVIELAGIRVENLGTTTAEAAREKYGLQTIDYYGGATPDDSWLPAARERIERFRKANLQLRVLNAAGKPVPGATVKLEQTRSAFRWGTAVNQRLVEQSPDGDQYRAQVKRLFNTAVLENDLKWRQFEGNPTVQQRAGASLDWLQANGLEVRGHTLVWGGAKFLPDRLKGLEAPQLRAEVEKRVRETVAANRGKVYIWDVVNEAASNTELWEKIGWDQFANTYRWARETDPKVKLAYNDYNISNEAPDNGSLRVKVEARIQKLIDAGAPLDILGDQAHIGTPLTPIPRVIEIWNDWGKRFKKPLEVTEFDVTVEDDAVHAKYVRDFLTAAFADPNIEAFLMWGFWEKAHWRGASGAMFRADWSPRPAQLVYEELVLKEWRTNATLPAGKDGRLSTRAFLGDYSATVTANGRSKTVPLKVAAGDNRQEIRLN